MTLSSQGYSITRNDNDGRTLNYETSVSGVAAWGTNGDRARIWFNRDEAEAVAERVGGVVVKSRCALGNGE